MNRRPFQYLFCALLLSAFAWGVLHLFEIRFARGDVYPSYSTLRADPLGAKALYDSLAGLPALQVSRNEASLEQFTGGRGTALFYVGANEFSWSEKVVVRLEKFVKAGGRLIISFFPQATETFLVERKDSSPTPGPSPHKTSSPEEKFLGIRDLAKRWDFKMKASAKLTDSKATVVDLADIDREISWHSALHFKDSEKTWKSIYTAFGFPVVIERAMGDGTIVLAADSYFLSNEAMHRDRHPAFLAWLVGANRQIVFDETHLGVREDPGVGTLMRSYHLGGLIFGLLVLALLAIWKNAAPLIPLADTEQATERVIAGKDSFAGLVNLLRRNIAPRELLRVCVEEWAKFQPRKAGAWQEKAARAVRIVDDSSDHDPVHKYREISLAVNETKWKPRT